MSKLKLATVWLDGCSGCHMSFLDLDERILELADLVEVVYSPLVDAKEFPDHVDITLVEGAVASVDDEHKIRKIRAHTKTLVAMGDCAVPVTCPPCAIPSGRRPSSTALTLRTRRCSRRFLAYCAAASAAGAPRARIRARGHFSCPGCPPSAGHLSRGVKRIVKASRSIFRR